MTLSAVAAERIDVMTSDTPRVGFADNTSAATPATCGVAIEVPEMVFVAVFDLCHAEVMLDPGAKRSTHDPKFEYDARASALVVAPTVNGEAARAGE